MSSGLLYFPSKAHFKQAPFHKGRHVGMYSKTILQCMGTYWSFQCSCGEHFTVGTVLQDLPIPTFKDLELIQ